ncbi:uncharacterized protein [Notamacropus eugenii]|uniref:uncharacterized protein n=1 Tax=Notamacropus eugenii TaxID=9315 RepID=UPI003B67E0E0
MFEFMHQRFLVLFLLLGVLLYFPCHVRGEISFVPLPSPGRTEIDTGNCTSKGVTSLHRTQGEHVLIHLGQNITKETELKLYLLSKHLLLLTFSPGESRTTRIIPRKEYEGRLSVPDDKTLMLMSVTSEDSGCYEIAIRSASGNMCIQTFNLTVSESVSTNPWIGLGVGLLMVLFFAFIFLMCFRRPEIYKKCLNNLKKRHLQKKEHTIRTEPEEERRLEEGCELVQIRFPSDQETQTGTHG